MQQWQIGEVKVTRIVEIEITGGTRFILPDATPDACLPMRWLAPHFMSEEGKLVMSVHALVVDTPGLTILVDTCIGNDKERDIPAWSNLQTPFLSDLAQAGYDRDKIDVVLCTHLHVDHVGWNTMLVDGKWVPTFPNARYLFGKKEWQYWGDEADPEIYGNIMQDSVRPIIEAGLEELVSMDHRLCDQVCLVPTPGHTPGHVSVEIRSQGQEALITGDCIHHPCQIGRTEWCSSADYDSAQGRSTREKLVEKMADTDVLMIGTHFSTPTAGYVLRQSEGGYWFRALE